MEWLLPCSLILITSGIALSVWEEWAKVGLTDTSYTTLVLWVVGLIGIMAWGVWERDSFVFVVALLPAGLFAYWIGLKLSDRSRRRR